MSDPELLVLDEPTVALDVEARRGFWAAMRSFAAGGKTVIFATHYLEEADAYADRVVLMAHGEVVADGPTTEIKARVGARTIRATLPDADEAELAALPGVSRAERHGETVILTGPDSDAAIRALLERYDDARDIEITRRGARAGLPGADQRPIGSARRGGGPRMSTAVYTRYELLRAFRNRRVVIFALAFPVILYLAIAGAQPRRHRLLGHRHLAARSTSWSAWPRSRR